MNPLFLVRHADAGPMSGGPDRELTARGHAEAAGLVAILEGRPLARVLSSPLPRCRQTVAPLLRERGLALEVDAAFVEGADLAGVVERVEALSEPTLLCSHGDLIPGLLERWRRSGLAIGADFACEKASVWAVEMDAGAAITARYYGPQRGHGG